MALKLGELLLKENKISAEQLETALKCQVFYGLKLGSSLIELGYISDGDLVSFLSQKLGVPAVHRDDLMDIPPETIKLVPDHLADKYRVVPLKTEGRKLFLAMQDPTDFSVIDEISFATGFIIQPRISAEIHISYALEKFYRIKRDTRYIRVAGGLHDMAQQKESSHWQDGMESGIHCVTLNPEEPDNAIAAPSEGELLSIDTSALENRENPPRETRKESAPLEKYTIDQLSTEFASASNRDDVADVFIKYLGQQFDVASLFIVRKEICSGWRAVSLFTECRDFEEITLSTGQQSVIREVTESGRFYMGPLAGQGINRLISEKLGIAHDMTVLALPVIMLKKTVAIVLVTVEPASFSTHLQELQRIVHKASLAFEMLIIKNKILLA